MAAVCVITIAYEINGERGFLSNAPEGELKNQDQAMGKSASLKILHGWKTLCNEIMPLHISAYSVSLGFSCYEMEHF